MPLPRYKIIVDDLAGRIRSGELGAGTRLPTHRELAAREHIAVVTATRVYAELEAAGLVSREQGRGTFVRDLALPQSHGIDQQAVADDIIDLNFNYPALPEQADLLRQALREIASSGDLDALLRYQPHAGRPGDRAVIARHLKQRGIPAHPDQLLVVNGAQHGLTVALMATLNPGDILAVDALTYPGIKVLAQALRLELLSVPASARGTDLDALDAACAARPVRAIYTMPTLHNPLGAVLDEADRGRLAAIASRHGQIVIEDASYAYLVDAPPPPVAALAPDLTIYVSGLSKSIATGLRVGFLTASAALVPALERAIRATTWNTPALTVNIACRWLTDGTADHLETRKRADATRRQSVAREVFHGLPYLSHPNSYFTWLPLPDDARADRIAASLADQRISVSTAEPFATSSHVPQAIRVALGSADLHNLRTTLCAVAHAIHLDATR
ncbi:MAG: GntR family transcriptional regulator [Pseudonocardia sp. SCN 72-86]|nr:MAG: GntR family transcriptional regulator [Pseudonocardia sp. SCN 72-86]